MRWKHIENFRSSFKISLILYNAAENRISAIREFVFNPGIGGR